MKTKKHPLSWALSDFQTGAELRERFEQFRMGVKACSTETVRGVVNLYISEFGGLKSALEKLSYKQKLFYQLKVKEELLDIRSHD